MDAVRHAYAAPNTYSVPFTAKRRPDQPESWHGAHRGDCRR